MKQYSLCDQITYPTPRKTSHLSKTTWQFDTFDEHKNATTHVFTRFEDYRALSAISLNLQKTKVAFYSLEKGHIIALIKFDRVVKSVKLFSFEKNLKGYDLIKLLIEHFITYKHSAMASGEQTSTARLIKELIGFFNNKLNYEVQVNHRGVILGYDISLDPIEGTYTLIRNNIVLDPKPISGSMYTLISSFLDQQLAELMEVT